MGDLRFLDVATRYDEAPITLKDMGHAAHKLVGEPAPAPLSGPRIEEQALASIYDQAFTTPVSVQRYPEEAADLCRFITQKADDGAEDMSLRMIALPFGYVDVILERAMDHDDPVVRGKYLDLIRAVAVFFARRELGAIVGCDREEQSDAARHAGTT